MKKILCCTCKKNRMDLNRITSQTRVIPHTNKPFRKNLKKHLHVQSFFVTSHLLFPRLASLRMARYKFIYSLKTLNFLATWVHFPNWRSFLLTVSGGGCQYYAKLQNGTMWNGWQNKHAKLWVFCEMKVVATDDTPFWWQLPQNCAGVFWRSLEWHVADIKNIAINDHEGKPKFRNYRAVFQNLDLRDSDWCSTDDGNSGCHGLAQAFSIDHLNVVNVKNIAGNDHAGNHKDRMKFCNYRAVLRNLNLRDQYCCSMVDIGQQCLDPCSMPAMSPDNDTAELISSRPIPRTLVII